MFKDKRTLYDKKVSWSASGQSIIDLPLIRYWWAMMLQLSITYDTAASPTRAEDGVLRAIKKITLEVNGTAIRSFEPRYHWYKNVLDLAVKPEFKDVTTTVANDKTARLLYPIFFAVDPNDENDVSALLPLPYVSSARLIIDWAAAADIGTNQTITAGTLLPTVHERILTSGEELAHYGKTGEAVASVGSELLVLYESQTPKTVDAAYSNYEFVMDLPTGKSLTRTFLYSLLAGVRDDTLIDRFKVQDARSDQPIIDQDWEASQQEDQAQYRINTPLEGDRFLTGLTVLDYRDHGSLHLQGRKTAEVTLGMTTIAPSGTTRVIIVNEAWAKAAFQEAAQ